MPSLEELVIYDKLEFEKIEPTDYSFEDYFVEGFKSLIGLFADEAPQLSSSTLKKRALNGLPAINIHYLVK
jgi:hypothetical protein